MQDTYLNAIIYEENGLFVGHVLQMDLVVTGSSEKEVIEDLIDVCEAQLSYAAENDNFDHVFRSAPPEIWKMFRKVEVAAQFYPDEETKASRESLVTAPVSLSAVLAPA